MKISKDKDNLIIKIPLRQNSYDAVDNLIGQVPNVVGVIVEKIDGCENFEQGIYQLNDLGYKDDIQLGMPLIKTYFEDDEFRKLCKELKIDIWEYPACVECRNPLWGSFTLGDKGNICLDCEHKLKKG